MKKLESLDSLKSSKLSNDNLSKFRGGASYYTTEEVLGPKTYRYRRDALEKLGERAATR